MRSLLTCHFSITPSHSPQLTNSPANGFQVHHPPGSGCLRAGSSSSKLHLVLALSICRTGWLKVPAETTPATTHLNSALLPSCRHLLPRLSHQESHSFPKTLSPMSQRVRRPLPCNAPGPSSQLLLHNGTCGERSVCCVCAQTVPLRMSSSQRPSLMVSRRQWAWLPAVVLPEEQRSSHRTSNHQLSTEHSPAPVQE